jgi:hypothetical protein
MTILQLKKIAVFFFTKSTIFGLGTFPRIIVSSRTVSTFPESRFPESSFDESRSVQKKLKFDKNWILGNVARGN